MILQVGILKESIFSQSVGDLLSDDFTRTSLYRFSIRNRPIILMTYKFVSEKREKKAKNILCEADD
jgi:hypothetical protein